MLMIVSTARWFTVDTQERRCDVLCMEEGQDLESVDKERLDTESRLM